MGLWVVSAAPDPTDPISQSNGWVAKHANPTPRPDPDVSAQFAVGGTGILGTLVRPARLLASQTMLGVQIHCDLDSDTQRMNGLGRCLGVSHGPSTAQSESGRC